MAYKRLEDLFDTLLYLGIIMGALIFFCWHWKTEYQARYAELVLQEFLTDVSSDGKITRESYEQMIWNLNRINPAYTVKIACTEYVLQPIYTLIPQTELDKYYLNRNTRKKIELQMDEVIVKEEEADELRLQKETNADILATAGSEYLPLPEEEKSITVEAVRKYQEVYEGEALITLCRVISSAGNYYAEAEQVYEKEAGQVILELTVDGEMFSIPVEVFRHPRKVICTKGHEVVNSAEIIAEAKHTGNINCPYCKQIPESVTCNVSVLYKKTGNVLEKEEIWLTVKYLDGHIEQITPNMEGWQDTYDANYCGIQQVIIQYRGKEDTVLIVTENNNCIQCENPCNERCFNDYEEFPYCTECMSKVLLFSGEVYEEEKQKENGELVAILDSEDELCLQYGAYVTLYLLRNGEYETILQREVKQNGRK